MLFSGLVVRLDDNRTFSGCVVHVLQRVWHFVSDLYRPVCKFRYWIWCRWRERCYPNISSCVLGVLVSVLLGFSGFAFSFLALWSFMLGSIFSLPVLQRPPSSSLRPSVWFWLKHWLLGDALGQDLCSSSHPDTKGKSVLAGNQDRLLWRRQNVCFSLSSALHYRITECLSLNISNSYCHFGSADGRLEICLSSIFPSPEATLSFLLWFAAQSGSFVHWQRIRGYETWPPTTISSQHMSVCLDS